MTAFPITDPNLSAQAEELLRGKVKSPLVKGRYISLAKPFRFGPSVQDLADQGATAG